MGAGKARSCWYPFSFSFVVLCGVLAFVAAAIPGGPTCHHIRRSSPVQAMTEISNIELAITKMLSDAKTDHLRDFFDDAAFDEAVARLGRERALAPFEASVEIYTHSTYVLLRKGQHALDPAFTDDYTPVLIPSVVKRLVSTYYPELAFDPWGELYRIFPGPWPEDMGPVVFRNYSPPTPGDKKIVADTLLMSGLDIETGEPLTFGVPAPSNQDVYIWSFGANLLSGQPIYDPSHVYAPPAQQHYEAGQEPELMGGGDDINNWDRHQTFMRFYN